MIKEFLNSDHIFSFIYLNNKKFRKLSNDNSFRFENKNNYSSTYLGNITMKNIIKLYTISIFRLKIRLILKILSKRKINRPILMMKFRSVVKVKSTYRHTIFFQSLSSFSSISKKVQILFCIDQNIEKIFLLRDNHKIRINQRY